MELVFWLRIIVGVLLTIAYLVSLLFNLNKHLNLFNICFLIGVFNLLSSYTYSKDDRKSKASICIGLGILFLMIGIVNLIYYFIGF